MRLMRLLCLALLCTTTLFAHAQSETDSLPTHSGAMILDLTGLHVTQRSAKPQGNEIGVRAHDSGHMELLTFLFLTPEDKSQTPSTCLAEDLKPILKTGKPKQQLNPFNKDDAASASALLTYPDGSQVLYRYFGKDDQCLLAQVYADKGTTLDVSTASALLDRQRYDADYRPTREDVSRYQNILTQGAPGSAAVASMSTPPAQSGRPLSLVAPTGKGGIVIPASGDPQWEKLLLYDEGKRPVLLASSKSTGLAVSYVLFPNLTKSTTPQICRDDVLNAGMHAIAPAPGMADIKNIRRSDHAPVHGQPLATGSYLIASLLDMKVAQQNLFGVASSPTVCAEIHISKTPYKPADDADMTTLLESFVFEPDYTPTAADYITMANVYYKSFHDFEAAAPYYQRGLDTLPSDFPRDARRFVIDQLSMSYGIGGKIKQSRAVNEAAIASDPDYPLYYYNLACADAEQGKAADARRHLEQAFARRQNTLPGEHLPDPTTDDSILKLKKDKSFWAFVESLPKS